MRDMGLRETIIRKDREFAVKTEREIQDLFVEFYAEVDTFKSSREEQSLKQISRIGIQIAEKQKRLVLIGEVNMEEEI